MHLGPLDLCFASSDHSSAPEIATLTLRSAGAGISKPSPVDADRFSAEYGGWAEVATLLNPKSRATEALIACNILNRMTALGRSESFAIGA